MAKILFVDDESQLLLSLKAFFEDHGHVVDACSSGEDALQLLDVGPYDLLILDWNLPGISGEEVCRHYRHIRGQAPVIFLTGKDDIKSLEIALESGGDDYVVKPFDIRELNARVKSVLKRRTAAYVPTLSVGIVILDPENQMLSTEDSSYAPIRLRAKENILLAHLLRHPNQIFSAQELLEHCWPSDSASGATSVRTWMGLLRQRLEDIGQPDLIRTVLGAGYVIEDKKVD